MHQLVLTPTVIFVLKNTALLNILFMFIKSRYMSMFVKVYTTKPTQSSYVTDTFTIPWGLRSTSAYSSHNGLVVNSLETQKSGLG